MHASPPVSISPAEQPSRNARPRAGSNGCTRRCETSGTALGNLPPQGRPSHASTPSPLDRGDEGGLAHCINRLAETLADLEDERRGRASEMDCLVALQVISHRSP